MNQRLFIETIYQFHFFTEQLSTPGSSPKATLSSIHNFGLMLHLLYLISTYLINKLKSLILILYLLLAILCVFTFSVTTRVTFYELVVLNLEIYLSQLDYFVLKILTYFKPMGKTNILKIILNILIIFEAPQIYCLCLL